MTFLEGVAIICAATGVVTALAFGVDRAVRRRRVVVALRRVRDRKVTPVERPIVLHPENGPLVEAWRLAASVIEEAGTTTADGLRDLARVVALTSTDPVSEKTRNAAAQLVDELGGAIRREAQRIREV